MFLYLSYFSRYFEKTSQAPQFDHFFVHISGTTEPILLIFELSLSWVIPMHLSVSKSVQYYSSSRDGSKLDHMGVVHF